MELNLLSDGYFTSDKSLLVYTKYQEQTYEAALKPPLIIAGKKKILAETGIGEPPDACMNLLYVMFAFLDAEK
jgi:hypothetical protein